jgi:N-methylhydantoinase A
VLDIHTIGAGGGSIASIDAGGALRVGPQSAGANPGPACYGRGESTLDQPTVTDANLILGRLAEDYFLGGRIRLFPERTWKVLHDLGARLQLDPVQVALGMIQVVNAHMVRALRVISVERGYDPSYFTLVSFGGAGGLHASALARELGIPRILVPPNASTLSSFGMLAANVIKDYSRTVMLEGEIVEPEIDAFFDELIKNGVKDLSLEGFEPDEIILKPALDMRYRGQSYELMVPYKQDFQNAFHEIHQKTFGYARPDAPIEIVNVRLRAIGLIPTMQLQAKANEGSDPDQAFINKRDVYLSEEPVRLPFYDGERLASGNHLIGPAIVLRSDTTILIHAGDFAEVDPFGNLLLQIGE